MTRLASTAVVAGAASICRPPLSRPATAAKRLLQPCSEPPTASTPSSARPPSICRHGLVKPPSWPRLAFAFAIPHQPPWPLCTSRALLRVAVLNRPQLGLSNPPQTRTHPVDPPNRLCCCGRAGVCSPRRPADLTRLTLCRETPPRQTAVERAACSLISQTSRRRKPPDATTVGRRVAATVSFQTRSPTMPSLYYE